MGGKDDTVAEAVVHCVSLLSLRAVGASNWIASCGGCDLLLDGITNVNETLFAT